MTSLNWRDSAHWSNSPAPCVHCGRQTNLRDDSRRPSHKMCAEAAIDAETPAPTREPAVDANGFKAAALACAARGWHVIPLVPGGKEAAIKDWPNRATTDPERIARCWDTGLYNVAVVTGPSRLVVVDLDMPKHPGDKPDPDDPKEEEWARLGVRHGRDVLAVLAERAGKPFPADTFTVTTRSGGTHLYFQAPDGEALPSTVEKHGWKVDTRATGGYVIAAGSVRDARPYTVARDLPVAPLPDWLLALLRPAPAPRRKPRATPIRAASAYAAVALRNEKRTVATAPQGRRAVTLLAAARSLGRFVASGDLSRRTVEDALREGAYTAGLDDDEITKVVTSALNWSIRNNPGDAA